MRDFVSFGIVYLCCNQTKLRPQTPDEADWVINQLLNSLSSHKDLML